MGNGLKLRKPIYSKSSEIRLLQGIPEVMLSLAPTHAPTVKKGDNVLLGQLIAGSSEDASPVYSSVSGTVLGIENIDGTGYIRIENDGEYTCVTTPLFERKKISEMSREDMLERIRLCAIPEWKLLSELTSPARLIINCLDDDLYTSDKKCAIRSSAAEIVGGSKILMKLLRLGLCEILIEKRSTEYLNDLLEYIGESTLFDIVEAEGRYPFGCDERVLSQIPSSDRSEEGGICVISPYAAAAIYKAFAKGTPSVSRLISVGGSAVSAGGCYEVPLGTPAASIAKCVVKHTDGEPASFVLTVNGALNGTVSDPEKVYVRHDVSSLVFTEECDTEILTDVCVGCARCDAVCPEGLSLSSLVRKNDDFSAPLLDAGITEGCGNCGACNYVCPAKLPVREIVCGTDRTDPYKKHKLKSTPILRSPDSVRTMNLDLIFALLALVGWAVCRFGPMALAICATSLVCAVGADVLYQLLTGGSVRSALDLNSAVCGLLCALSLSVNTPLYVCAAASLFAVVIVRGAFGGFGKNIIHSAFCARVFVSLFWHDAFVYDSGRSYTLFDHLIGNTEGALGEVSFIILVACALYLAYRRAIALSPMLATLLSFAVTAFLCAPAGGDAVEHVKITFISSPILFVSIFYSSEYSALPSSTLGRIAYGVLSGSAAAVISRFTSYEGAYVAAVAAGLVCVLIFNRITKAKHHAVIPHESAKNDALTEADCEGGLEDNETELWEGSVFSEEIAGPAKDDTCKESGGEVPEEPSGLSLTASSASSVSEDDFDIDSSELLESLSAEIGLEEDVPAPSGKPSRASTKNDPLDSSELVRKLFDEVE